MIMDERTLVPKEPEDHPRIPKQPLDKVPSVVGNTALIIAIIFILYHTWGVR